MRVGLAWIDPADPTDRAIALGLGEALRRAGHDVAILGPRRRDAAPRERLEGFPLHRVEPRGGASKLVALGRELAIDVWHVHVFARDHRVFAQAASASGRPFVATLHLVLEDYLPFVGGREGLRRLLAGAASVATVSRSARAELGAILPEWRRRSVVIPNGAPSAPVPARQAEAPYVVCPARLAPYKGQDVLLMAFAQARERVPGLRLYLCGRDQTGGALAGFAGRLGLSSAVRLTGGLAPRRLARLVAGARAVVLPSRRENLPLAVLEAMAAGQAIVATQVGGVPELVRHRESALLVPPADPQRLADALVEVCRSGPLRRRLGAAARRRARSFSWSAAARRYAALYRAAAACLAFAFAAAPRSSEAGQFLTDPFLQSPGERSVRVVWFTEFEGRGHAAIYGPNLIRRAPAVTTRLTRAYEDAESRHPLRPSGPAPVLRTIFRHEAFLEALPAGRAVPYYARSIKDDVELRSRTFTARGRPPKGAPLTLLLTSDHQLKPRSAANIQKAAETAGTIDAVVFAGDLANVPDRASEWFDDARGNAFFPVLQGRASYALACPGGTITYRGAPVIQSAPLFTAIGNHEVMGRFRPETSLSKQIFDAYPRGEAAKRLKERGAKAGGRALEDESHNVRTYEELFTLPRSGPGGERYYATTFGDVRLVSLFATRQWRPGPEEAPEPHRGKYAERAEDLADPSRWGFGSLIFEPIGRGSAQFEWLKREVAGAPWRRAAVRVAFFHEPVHTLGDKAVPAFTDPVPVVERKDGRVVAVAYEYPPEKNFLVHDVAPLLEEAGAHLVLYGHSHLWNRFRSARGTSYLETSNVGNSYGAFWKGGRRPNLPRAPRAPEDYPPSGDPHGLEPIAPSLAPFHDAAGEPEPFVSSNELTVFTLLRTATRRVESWRWDPCRPDEPAVKFDEFGL
ncbi:MAG: glycosyltransferase family 4 protein [Elusimicrobia bacterium]|nr:glycosyltransferase family 4 protein [Elusimicrobiota bacterium]